MVMGTYEIEPGRQSPIFWRQLIFSSGSAGRRVSTCRAGRLCGPTTWPLQILEERAKSPAQGHSSIGGAEERPIRQPERSCETKWIQERSRRSGSSTTGTPLYFKPVEVLGTPFVPVEVFGVAIEANWAAAIRIQSRRKPRPLCAAPPARDIRCSWRSTDRRRPPLRGNLWRQSYPSNPRKHSQQFPPFGSLAEVHHRRIGSAAAGFHGNLELLRYSFGTPRYCARSSKGRMVDTDIEARNVSGSDLLRADLRKSDVAVFQCWRTLPPSNSRPKMARRVRVDGVARQAGRLRGNCTAYSAPS